MGIVVVTVEVTVEVIAECSAGFGASCFWHPVRARIAATADTAIIAVIFFMLFHPQSSQKLPQCACRNKDKSDK